VLLLLLPLLLPCFSSPAGAGNPLVIAYGMFAEVHCA
jgi:hypothetical protein